MKILIDTNIAIDVLLKRECFFDASYSVLRLSALDKITASLTANSITDIYYFVQKSNKDIVTSKRIISELIKIVHIADVTGADITASLKSKTNDFEDALVSVVAKRIKAEYIITRNIKDFKDSPIPAIVPQDFLDEFFPND